ncbi:MAG: hypothetical protein OT477_16915 [Chloroflexi bacterium]|nr:hypothetical protein [Chloroflexota bacterium]
MSLSPVLLLHSFLFTFTLWLGLYLIRRDGQKMVLRLAGLGLLGYTLILVGELMWRPLAERANFLPALLWLGATLHLLPEETHGRERLWRVWRWGALPTAALLLALPSLTVALIPLLLGCVLGLAILSRRSPFPHTVATLATVTLFFALSMGALLWPWAWFGQGWTLVLLGTDLAGLGLLIGVWDAFDEGETLWPHMVRSAVAALFYAGALGGLVLIAAVLDGQFSLGNQWLLLAALSFGVASQIFAEPLARLFDWLAFPRHTSLSQQREELRETLDLLPRVATLDPLALEEAEFARLTRRAISHMGDLPKLATSPLAHLPLVLASSETPIGRAQALKALLTDCIVRLKPAGKGEFGTTAEWRFYNALYFPYVVGLKPYARREGQQADAIAQQALDWFQTAVPERTLHNWQNSAAKLVADDLKMAGSGS